MSRFNIITIERQFASGGREIGKLLAEKLGYQFYNEEILELAAKRLNVSSSNIGHLEEVTQSSLMISLALAYDFTNNMPYYDVLFNVESEIIREIVQKGNCIIVGRCAGYSLSNRNDVLNVFIHADKEHRMERAVNDYKVPKNKAEAVLTKTDKRRSDFYSTYSGKEWGSMGAYDICLDSGRLDVNTCSDVICSIIL